MFDRLNELTEVWKDRIKKLKAASLALSNGSEDKVFFEIEIATIQDCLDELEGVMYESS